ncbi:hypothetical protein V8G54_018209 [Vigna mungo]|uniref:Uncharacterized protein n=1 Tax=Vigna mungo TaxID=3915 RepID=A0AAQ3RTR5_VIGMU
MVSRFRYDKQRNSNIIVVPCFISSFFPTISTICSHSCISSVFNFARFLASDEGNNVTRLPQPSTSTLCKLEKLTIPSIFSFHTHFKFGKSDNISFFKRNTIPYVSSMSNISCADSHFSTFNSSMFFK